MSGFGKMLVVLVVSGLFLSACSSGRQSPVEVRITLKEFGIESSLTRFEAGVPYRFVVTNAGAIEHEFMIMPPLIGDPMGMDMEHMDGIALAMIPAGDLAPGATQSLSYTFAESAAAGTLEFACHTPGHYEANMRLPVSVE